MSDFVNPFDEAGFTSDTVSIPAPSNDPSVNVSIFYRHFKPASPSSAVRPILLLHGHPQTHVIWSTIAPALAATGKWEIIVPDNRGNGSSSAPVGKSDGEYSRYSKREMARDMVVLMESLGWTEFWVVAHDRGARVAHRLALDWEERVKKMVLLDIAPTLDMYETTDHNFAKAYWHWFFLLQPSLPETFISANPQAYLDALVTRFPRTAPSHSPSSSSAQIEQYRTASYLSNLSQPSAVHAMCEDYRASAPSGPDLNQDRKDRQDARKVQCPVKVLWGKHGVIQAMYAGGLELWKQRCENVQGEGVDCGHYIPEEAPERVLREIEEFFP